MTAEIGATVREHVLAASTSFEQIDGVVMTTFGFGAEFVEEHALAAVLGLDGAATPGRRQAVHEALADTPVTVCFDATTGSAPSGRYRYTAVPVPVVRRLFHPKIIAIAGRHSGGAVGVWLGVGSANLTMSGWGRNTESFGATWLLAPDQQAAGTLTGFLRWLVEATGLATVDADSGLSRVATALGALPSKSTDDHGRVQLYVSTEQPDGFAHFVRDIASGNVMRVLSPYWSDVEANATSFGAAQVQLLPALRSDAKGPGILREQVVGLPEFVSLWRNDGDNGQRFWHAKTYEFSRLGAGASHVAVGSCNFSGPGLAGGAGNVEAMLLRSGELVGGPQQDALRPLELEALDDLPAEADDAPEPLPVGIVVLWDWATGEYRWQLDDGGVGRSYELRLPHDVTVSDAEQGGRLTGAPPARADTFELRWGAESQSGVIVEVNLHLSTRSYGRRLRPAEILDSWRGRPVYVGGDGDGDGGERDWSGAQSEEVADELPFYAFDLYDFYRSIRLLDERVQEQVDRPSVQRGMLVTRPDSLWALAHLTARSEAPAALRFLVLCEVVLLAARYDEVLGDQTLERLRALLDEARAATELALGVDVSDGAEAARILEWFESQAAALGVGS